MDHRHLARGLFASMHSDISHSIVRSFRNAFLYIQSQYRPIARALPGLIRATLALALLAAAQPARAEAESAAPTLTVYHISEGVEQASRALRFVANHLSGDPSARIVLVGHGPGVDFLLADAADRNGTQFAPGIRELIARGVEFEACNNTLLSRHIDRSALIPGVKVVPSGVVELSRLQAKGYAYLKP